MPVRGNYEDLKTSYDRIEKGKSIKKKIEDDFLHPRTFFVLL